MDRIFELFNDICTIPHCSGKCSKMSKYIISFAKKNGFKVSVDKIGNILCQKGNPRICLQSHYDMVCMGKAPDIEVYQDKGYIKAKNSTLGADNGIGMSIMFYMMEQKNDIELLFTIDEEIGLIGANNIELCVKSPNLLNLDSEEEGDIFIGCAGGVDIYAEKKYKKKLLKKERDFYKVSVCGLQGGHSGADIDKGIKNSIKELACFLSSFKREIIEINGGEANNSIPKNAYAIISVKKRAKLPRSGENIKLKKIDKNFTHSIKNGGEIVHILNGFAHGVREFDKQMGIPRTSINLALIKTERNSVKLEFFARSNEDDLLKNIMFETKSYLKCADFKVRYKNEFPAWKPEINNLARKVREISKEYFKKPSYKAIHAGLECGVLLKKIGKNINATSIGPNIFNPHSEEERCEIESVRRVAKIVEKIIEDS